MFPNLLHGVFLSSLNHQLHKMQIESGRVRPASAYSNTQDIQKKSNHPQDSKKRKKNKKEKMVIHSNEEGKLLLELVDAETGRVLETLNFGDLKNKLLKTYKPGLFIDKNV